MDFHIRSIIRVFQYFQTDIVITFGVAVIVGIAALNEKKLLGDRASGKLRCLVVVVALFTWIILLSTYGNSSHRKIDFFVVLLLMCGCIGCWLSPVFIYAKYINCENKSGVIRNCTLVLLLLGYFGYMMFPGVAGPNVREIFRQNKLEKMIFEQGGKYFTDRIGVVKMVDLRNAHLSPDFINFFQEFHLARNMDFSSSNIDSNFVIMLTEGNSFEILNVAFTKVDVSVIDALIEMGTLTDVFISPGQFSDSAIQRLSESKIRVWTLNQTNNAS